MKKYMLTIALAMPLLMTAAASAQTIHLRVTVPFKFIAAGATLPAGEYERRPVFPLGALGNGTNVRSRNSAGFAGKRGGAGLSAR